MKSKIICFIFLKFLLKISYAINLPDIVTVNTYSTEKTVISSCEKFEEFIKNDDFYIPWSDRFIHIFQPGKNINFALVKNQEHFTLLQYQQLTNNWNDNNIKYLKCEDNFLIFDNGFRLNLINIVFNKFKNFENKAFLNKFTFENISTLYDKLILTSYKITLPNFNSHEIFDNKIENTIIFKLNNTNYALVLDEDDLLKSMLYSYSKEGWELFNNKVYTYKSIQHVQNKSIEYFIIFQNIADNSLIKFRIASLTFYKLSEYSIPKSAPLEHIDRNTDLMPTGNNKQYASVTTSTLTNNTTSTTSNGEVLEKSNPKSISEPQKPIEMNTDLMPTGNNKQCTSATTYDKPRCRSALTLTNNTTSTTNNEELLKKNKTFLDSTFDIFGVEVIYQGNQLTSYKIENPNLFTEEIYKNKIEDTVIFNHNDKFYALIIDEHDLLKSILFIRSNDSWHLINNEIFTYNKIEQGVVSTRGNYDYFLVFNDTKNIKKRINIQSVTFYKLPLQIAEHKHPNPPMIHSSSVNAIYEDVSHIDKKHSGDRCEPSKNKLSSSKPVTSYSANDKIVFKNLENYIVQIKDNMIYITEGEVIHTEDLATKLTDNEHNLTLTISKLKHFIDGKKPFFFFSRQVTESPYKILYLLARIKSKRREKLFKLYYYDSYNRVWQTNINGNELYFECIFKKSSNISLSYFKFVTRSTNSTVQLQLKLYLNSIYFIDEYTK